MTDAPPRRRALLLGCGTFVDRSLAPLRSPRRDVEEFRRVLADPVTGRYAVAANVDCTSRQAQRGIEGFFSAARVSDAMNLLYLSCHGVQDAQGRLYFAFADTERDFLSSTAVSADWVRDRIYASRSKATVVLVDCCFSGAFIKGMRARSADATNVESLVRGLPDGSGVAVLTASGDTEASFEDADSPVIRPSYFTDALITGIATGAADLNRDGHITVDELYDYIYDQVLSGPSSQRPRRLGMGEGVLVVSDAAHPRSAPAPVVRPVSAPPRPDLSRPAPLVTRGVLGWVSFDGQWVVIGKEGVGHVYKGERRYNISQLSGIAVKPATRLHYGFFQVILTGVTPAPVVRFGPNAGRPPMTDDDSISFARNANDEFRRIREAVQEAINAAHGRGRPAAPTTTPPAAPTDYDRGAHDGAQSAGRLPLAALDGLIGHHFDVVRWLDPWREHWSRTAGDPQPSAARPPAWLSDLAQYLGRYAAPAGTTNSSFTPSLTYLGGFCVGLRNAWSNAVRAGLLPADGPPLTRWATRPPDQLKLTKPLAEATLQDLGTARQRARRATLVRRALRGLLWVTIGLFLIMEIAAIAITVDGGWTDADGELAANQAPDAIFANVCCLVPLIALITIAVVDLRRVHRKKHKPASPAAHRQPHQPPASIYRN